MKKVAGEAIAAIMVTLAIAEGMQIIWWLSVFFREPLDKIFIAASAICYLLFRFSKDHMGNIPWGGE